MAWGGGNDVSVDIRIWLYGEAVQRDLMVVLGSESGVLELDPSTIVAKGRLQPGRMFLVDTERGCIRSDEEVKDELAGEHSYGEWLHGEAVGAGMVMATDLSRRLGLVDDAVDARVREAIAAAGLPVRGPGWPAERYVELIGTVKEDGETTSDGYVTRP